MNANTSRRSGRRAVACAAGAVGCGVAAGVLLLAPHASAEGGAPDPTLRISVDNGHTSAKAGDRLDYTISVENLGAETARDLRITQTMPPGLTFRSADRKGEARKGEVLWLVDIEPSSTAVFRTTMKLGATSDDVLRLATVACASVSAAKPPIVCAAHSDELPAGAQAADADHQPASPHEPDPFPLTEFVLVGATIALLTGGGILGTRFARRRAGRAEPSS